MERAVSKANSSYTIDRPNFGSAAVLSILRNQQGTFRRAFTGPDMGNTNLLNTPGQVMMLAQGWPSPHISACQCYQFKWDFQMGLHMEHNC